MGFGKIFSNRGKNIEDLMAYIATLDMSVKRRTALDFGCGVGRLTQALCKYYKKCSGVDISFSMINLARRYNRHGDSCRYDLNTVNDLKIFENNTFDLIITFIVLQHMTPEYSKNYIREFVRVLQPGGCLIFQIPSKFKEQVVARSVSRKCVSLVRSLVRSLRMRRSAADIPPGKRAKEPEELIQMYGADVEVVKSVVKQSGGKIVEIREDGWSGPEWESYTYTVTK